MRQFYIVVYCYRSVEILVYLFDTQEQAQVKHDSIELGDDYDENEDVLDITWAECPA